MNVKYKKVYIILSLWLVIFLGGFTAVNVFIYGSVMQINIPILILVMVFPLFSGFKEKKFYKHTVLIILSYFILILIATWILLPNVTFDEVKASVELLGPKWEKQLKRHTDKPGYLYAGDYMITTNQGNFSVGVNSGLITQMELEDTE